MTITTKLRNGVTVLGKLYKGETYAKTYANRTQAEKAAAAVGGQVIQPRLGPVFFVMMEG
jgi:hypothetical protein